MWRLFFVILLIAVVNARLPDIPVQRDHPQKPVLHFIKSWRPTYGTWLAWGDPVWCGSKQPIRYAIDECILYLHKAGLVETHTCRPGYLMTNGIDCDFQNNDGMLLLYARYSDGADDENSYHAIHYTGEKTDGNDHSPSDYQPVLEGLKKTPGDRLEFTSMNKIFCYDDRVWWLRKMWFRSQIVQGIACIHKK